MKNLTYILIILLFATSCKKAKITKTMNGSSWELQQILSEDKDVTSKIKEYKIVYLNLEYSKKEITFKNPTKTYAIEEEVGTWTLEKIVPTVGDKYFLIKNEIPYNFERRKVFNLTEYGNDMQLTDNNTLTQNISYRESEREIEYTIIYKKIN